MFAGLVFTEHQPGVGVVTDGHDCNAVFEASKYRSSCFRPPGFVIIRCRRARGVFASCHIDRAGPNRLEYKMAMRMIRAVGYACALDLEC